MSHEGTKTHRSYSFVIPIFFETRAKTKGRPVDRNGFCFVQKLNFDLAISVTGDRAL